MDRFDRCLVLSLVAVALYSGLAWCLWRSKCRNKALASPGAFGETWFSRRWQELAARYGQPLELGRTTREPDNSTERVAPHMSKKGRRLIAEKRRKAERKSAKKEKAKEEREAKQYEDISEARESVDPEEIIAPDEQVPAALTRKEKRLLAERRRKSARKSEKKAKTNEEAAAKAEADARAAAWQQARAKAEAERSKASNARPSLLALPAELRNEIWRLVLVQRQIIVINGPGYFHTEPGLLKVTKSIRQEASGIYYVDNKSPATSSTLTAPSSSAGSPSHLSASTKIPLNLCYSA